MTKVLAVAAVLGACLVIAAAGLVDYRLGLAVAGFGLLAFGLLTDGDA